MVLLSLGWSLLDCNNFDVDLCLLPHKVRESEANTILFVVLVLSHRFVSNQLDSGGIERENVRYNMLDEHDGTCRFAVLPRHNNGTHILAGEARY